MSRLHAVILVSVYISVVQDGQITCLGSQDNSWATAFVAIAFLGCRHSFSAGHCQDCLCAVISIPDGEEKENTHPGCPEAAQFFNTPSPHHPVALPPTGVSPEARETSASFGIIQVWNSSVSLQPSAAAFRALWERLTCLYWSCVCVCVFV